MCSRAGFTLIELLTVIAIITILVAIMMPTLGQARVHAKNVKTRAMLKSIGDGLEAFRNENDSDEAARERNGFPPSAEAEDPAVAGDQNIYGAHWLVRYTMGKDLNGYAPRRNAPASMQNPGDVAEQVQWYEFDSLGQPNVDRVGPYVPADATTIVKTKDLPQSGSNPSMIREFEEQVFTDSFGFPVLYYVANARQASKKGAAIAAVDNADADTPAIYSFRDNEGFTGRCEGLSCTTPPWDFGDGILHYIKDFGSDAVPSPSTIANDIRTFPYYIMNKDVYEATKDENGSPDEATLKPYRPDSFLLITAGKDGFFGTSDDVTNFD